MKTRTLIITLTFFILSACDTDTRTFNSKDWKTQMDGTYPYREFMVSDLLKNHLDTGMKYEKVIDILGDPVWNKDSLSNKIWYEILIDYGFDIDPVSGEDLVLTFNQDSTLRDYKINEWKK